MGIMASIMPRCCGRRGERLYYLRGTNPIVATSDTEAVGFNFGVKFTTSPTVNTIRGLHTISIPASQVVDQSHYIVLIW